MYKRIEEITEGKVHSSLPMIHVTPQQVELEIVEGATVQGSFHIKSQRAVPVKGVVLSSDLRMEVINPQFQETETEIRFVFHGETMREGEVVNGDFYILCNGGEFNLSFCVMVKKLSANSSIGKITGMEGFVKLYKSNPTEALKIFRTSGFKGLLETDTQRLYYRLLSVKPVERDNIEEFLIGCQLKERVSFRLGENRMEFPAVTEVIEEKIPVTLNGWGYASIDISADQPYILLEKTKLTGEDFNGDTYEFRFQIYPARLHAGKNYARITFSNRFQQETVEIGAALRAVVDLDQEDRRKTKAENLQICRLYEGYLARKLVLGQWAAETIRILRHRRDENRCEDLDILWLAYAYQMNKQFQEAAWILQEYGREHVESMTTEWAFYLYLLYMTEKDELLRGPLSDKIRDIYRQKNDLSWMRWLLMQVAEDSTETSNRQLQLLEQWSENGLHSPFLLARAAAIYEREPYLLLSLGRFELEVLTWICKNKKISKDLAGQIVRRSLGVRDYNPVLDRILTACYNEVPELEHLAAVCAYRIKGRCFEQKHHVWYDMAIQHDLQITGLYEAFMASLDPREVKVLPRSVQLYFQYSNQLSYRQKAVLYVNIIANRMNQPEVYDRYHEIMLEFTRQQILEGHMDDNLAVVYSHLLDEMTMDEPLAKALAKVLYMNKLSCVGQNVSRIIVQQECLKAPQVYPVINHEAFFPLYPGSYVILLETVNGQRVAGIESVQLERLMNPGHYIRRCLELAPGELPYLIHHMNGKTKLLHMDERMAGYVKNLVDSDLIAESYKSKIGPGFLEYCKNNDHVSDSKQYLKKIDFGKLSRLEKDRYLEALVMIGMYDLAWDFALEFGVGRMSAEALKKIVLFAVKQNDMQEDAHLIEMAYRCFVAGQTPELLVRYLCSYYEGPTNKLCEIWKKAVSMGIRVHEMEERLLVQMLFTTAFIPEVQSVFANYCKQGGREIICNAYLIYFSYEAYVNGLTVEPELYDFLEKVLMNARKPNLYQQIALISHYLQLPELNGEQQKLLERIVEQLLNAGIYLSCFEHLTADLKVRYHLYDLCMIEYRCATVDSTVLLHYRIEGRTDDFKEVELQPKFANICMCHLRLAADEELEYYISERSSRSEIITESRVINLAKEIEKLNNQAAVLYRLNGLQNAGDEVAFAEEMRLAMRKKELTERLFHVF